MKLLINNEILNALRKIDYDKINKINSLFSETKTEQNKRLRWT